VKRHLSAIAVATLWWAEPAHAQVPAPPPAPAPSAQDAAAPASAPAPEASTELQKQVATERADIDEQDARIVELERQIKELTRGPVAAPGKAAGPSKAKSAALPPVAAATEQSPFKVSGYVQAQVETHQDSEDQQAQGGALLNKNRFLLRRTRLKISRDWTYGGVMIELDANTVNGPAIGLQHAEVSLAYRNSDQTPLMSLTMGLFDNPFGREVVESPRDRPFMERSFGSREFFPAEPDLGVRFSGQVAWFRYSVAVVNGQPLGDRTGFVLQDPNSHKDVLGRVGVAVDLPPSLHVTGGVSVLNGEGYHPGADATKNTIIWRDQNEDGIFSPGEFQAVPGKAAVPAQNFARWALGADIGFELESMLGSSKLFAELSAGSNMDRNVFIADPITASFDQREFGYYVAVIHEFKQGPIVGFRFDSFNPNSDFLNRQAGKLVPTSETVTTYAPLVGFQVPHRARLIAEYDVIRDAMAINSAGVPTDKANNIFTVRLQGEL
jgi:Phosphate-selective porin O and P